MLGHHPAPVDPVFGVAAAFKKDPRKEKVDLSLGSYFDDNLQIPLMKAVHLAEEQLYLEEKSKEYLPISGDPDFIESVGALVFGKELWNRERSRIVGFQTVGGTSALRLASEVVQAEGLSTIFLPEITWPNHRVVFQRAHYLLKTYPYYDSKTKKVLFPSIQERVEKEKEALFLFHASCHNPTGADLLENEWDLLAKTYASSPNLILFDYAYQGFGRGIEEDSYAIRRFLLQGKEMIVAVSQSKNFGFYGERCGALFLVCESSKEAERAASLGKEVIRSLYSNPPRHPAKIAAKILQTPSLYALWKEELDSYRNRIVSMRSLLINNLAEKQGKRECLALLDRFGFFLYLGMTPKQVESLKDHHGIYLIEGGRLNVAGLTKENVGRVSLALSQV